MDGDSFLRIGKMHPDTIGVKLEEFPDVLFICGIPDCAEPEHIVEKTLERILPETVFYETFSFKSDSKSPKKTTIRLKTVNVTRGFIGSDKDVAAGKGEVIIFERNGTMLINPRVSELKDFLKATGAIS